MNKKVWDGKIEKDGFSQLQESSARVMGLNNGHVKIRPLKFSSYLEATKMNTPFVFPADRKFFKFSGVVIEGVSMNFDEGYKGGIIVFSTDVNALDTAETDSIVDRIRSFFRTGFKTMVNRLMHTRKLDDVFKKFEEIGGWSVGRFFRGRYLDKSTGTIYSEKSLSVEIIGITSEVLIKVAEHIAREFEQKEVLVKDHNNGKIFLVDQN